MKILPARTAPPNEAIDPRRHSPPAHFESYRSCLRWEFGFMCAFCLLHESDLFEGGAPGTGLMTIEHFVRQEGEGSARANEYANCFYACRFCNGARGSRYEVAEERGGRRLLNPCSNAWAEHFELVGTDRLRPRRGDADARYTYRAYDLDGPRKRMSRGRRRHSIERARAILESYATRQAFYTRVYENPRTAQDRTEALGEMAFLDAQRSDAMETLRRYRALPAPEACRCPVHARSLPRFIDVQCFEAEI